MCAIYAFTLFSDNVLPVKSALLMLKENPSGRFGNYSMDGLESFAVQAIEQRVTKKRIKIKQERGLMHNGPQRGKVGS